MRTLAVLSMAVAGNTILLFTSLTATTGVHALQVGPPTITHGNNLLPYSTPLSRPTIPLSASLSSSRLFGNQKRRHVNYQLHSTSSSSMPNGNGDSNNAMDAEITKSSSSSSSSTSSFLRAVDNFGMKLKPWALGAYEKSLKYSNSDNNNVNGTDNTSGSGTSKKRVSRAKNIMCRLQANFLWMSYIFYRGYRGFFVILPAVFREVYRQLEESNLVVDVYGDEDDEDEKEYAVNANAVEQQQPQQREPMRLRNRITISILLSGMLTLSYVVSGALRVLGKFIKTFTNTTSVESSFEAAAEEVAVNEDKLRNKVK